MEHTQIKQPLQYNWKISWIKGGLDYGGKKSLRLLDIFIVSLNPFLSLPLLPCSLFEMVFYSYLACFFLQLQDSWDGNLWANWAGGVDQQARPGGGAHGGFHH